MWYVPFLLIVVNINYCLPIHGWFGEMELFTNVDQVEDVFLETRATKSNRSHQEFGANSWISACWRGTLCLLIKSWTEWKIRKGHLLRFLTYSFGNFTDIRSSCLTNWTDSIDAWNPLGKKSICDKLAQLWAPGIHGQDVFLWNPVAVNRGQGLNGFMPLERLLTTNENPIGISEILDGITLREELRVWQNLRWEKQDIIVV